MGILLLLKPCPVHHPDLDALPPILLRLPRAVPLEVLHTSTKHAATAIRIQTLGVIWTGLGQVTLLLTDEAHCEPVSVLPLQLGFTILARVLKGAALEAVAGSRGHSLDLDTLCVGAVSQHVTWLPAVEADQLLAPGQSLLCLPPLSLQRKVNFLLGGSFPLLFTNSYHCNASSLASTHC